jgi:hypothetical protein
MTEDKRNTRRTHRIEMGITVDACDPEKRTWMVGACT